MNRLPLFSYRLAFALLGFSLVFSSGCRNCNRACGTGHGYGYSPTIAPPATYSLQIPSANGNPAYYVPGNPNPTATANLPSYLVDPSRRAPTPVTNNGGTNINQQNGWRPPGGTNLSGATPAGTSIAPQNVLAQSTASRAQVAATPAARSVVTSIDYATTRADDRLDQTRLPATDASNVRAPAGFINNGTRLAQVQTARVLPNTFNQPVTFNQSAPAVYNGTAVIARQSPTQPYYYGTPVVRQSVPTVLAQSTATNVPTSDGFSTGGWTDRELTASRSELNR